MLAVASGIGGPGGLPSHYGVLTISRVIGSLRLLARIEVVLTRRHGRRLPDSMPATECRQRGIRHLRACGHEFLMDSHEIPLALFEKLQDLLPVGFGFFGSVQF